METNHEMKIFSAAQIRKADAFSIRNEPVTSLKLMERAADACVKWLVDFAPETAVFQVFCGNGNNGGDGLAIAILLQHAGFKVNVFTRKDSARESADFRVNLKRLRETSAVGIYDSEKAKSFDFSTDSIIIDAIFGTGLNRSLEWHSAELIRFLNTLSFPKISIDIPSGLFADEMLPDVSQVFNADITLSFEFWKKAFLHPETGKYGGKIHLIKIGLHPEFVKNEPVNEYVIDDKMVNKIYQPRCDFAHKGKLGKTVIVAGTFGKMGAAVLATKAALRSGSGITFALSPECGCQILQTSCPEAMYIQGGKFHLTDFKFEDDYTLGIGPGVGTDPETEQALISFLKSYGQPVVLDADALNIISRNPAYQRCIPGNSVITPHPKEFERLFGKTENSFQMLDLARKKARELNIFIVLKGHHTQVITPENKVFYNITGNSGMAKGGSGDALLGIITSLLAQNYSSEHAALLGVWLHGKAGDLAACRHSKEAMLPSDLIDELGNVFITLNKK